MIYLRVKNASPEIEKIATGMIEAAEYMCQDLGYDTMKVRGRDVEATYYSPYKNIVQFGKKKIEGHIKEYRYWVSRHTRVAAKKGGGINIKISVSPLSSLSLLVIHEIAHIVDFKRSGYSGERSIRKHRREQSRTDHDRGYYEIFCELAEEYFNNVSRIIKNYMENKYTYKSDREEERPKRKRGIRRKTTRREPQEFTQRPTYKEETRKPYKPKWLYEEEYEEPEEEYEEPEEEYEEPEEEYEEPEEATSIPSGQYMPSWLKRK